MAGLPGTGKTMLARELARGTRGCVIGKDEIRAALFQPEDIEYSTLQDDFCMELMLDAARYLLAKEPARRIFLDGRSFSRSYQIDRVLNVAADLRQTWVILECICSDETARRRLEVERDQSHPAKNRSFELYCEVKQRFEPIMRHKTVISTDEALEVAVRTAMAALA